MPNIFISYTKGDSQLEANLLYQYLHNYLENENLFINAEDIGEGIDPETKIDFVLAQVDIVLVLLARNWETEVKRMHQEGVFNWGLSEIHQAIASKKKIIPVLLQREMPDTLNIEEITSQNVKFDFPILSTYYVNLERHEEDFEKLAQKNLKLTPKVDTSVNAVEALEQKIQSLEEESTKKHYENEILIKQVQELTIAKVEAENLVEENEGEENILEEKLRQVEQDLEETLQTSREQKKMTEMLEEQLYKHSTEEAELKSKIQKLTESNANFKKKNQNLEAEKIELRQLLETKKIKIPKKNDDPQKREIELKEEIEKLTQRNADLDEENETLEKEIIRLEKAARAKPKPRIASKKETKPEEPIPAPREVRKIPSGIYFFLSFSFGFAVCLLLWYNKEGEKTDTKKENALIEEMTYEQNNKINLQTSDPFEYHKLQPIVKAEKNQLIKGETYKAEVFLAAIDTTLKQKIILAGGKELQLSGGKAQYRTLANSLGLKRWGGKIEIQSSQTGEKITFPFAKEYLVGTSDVSISATKMNVFYVGIHNPVEISASGIPNEKLKPTISGGASIKSVGAGRYIVRVKRPGIKVRIAVNAEVNGKTVNLGTKQFYVKRLPDPLPKVARKKGGVIAKNVLLAQAGVAADIENLDIDVKFIVQSFTVTAFIRGYEEVQKSSNYRFTEGQKRIFKNLKSGSRVFISDIKAKGPDGTIRSLPAIALRIR